MGTPLAKSLAELAQPGPITDRLRRPRDVLRETAARLYAQGKNRSTVVDMMASYLAPEALTRPEAKRRTRRILVKWEQDHKFLDMVYQYCLDAVELQIPSIMEGVVAKAKVGRVDAARLVLEVTGRHNPKGDQTPTQIQLVVGHVPRPIRAQAVSPNGSEVLELE